MWKELEHEFRDIEPLSFPPHDQVNETKLLKSRRNLSFNRFPRGKLKNNGFVQQ